MPSWESLLPQANQQRTNTLADYYQPQQGDMAFKVMSAAHMMDESKSRQIQNRIATLTLEQNEGVKEAHQALMPYVGKFDDPNESKVYTDVGWVSEKNFTNVMRDNPLGMAYERTHHQNYEATIGTERRKAAETLLNHLVTAGWSMDEARDFVAKSYPEAGTSLRGGGVTNTFAAPPMQPGPAAQAPTQPPPFAPGPMLNAATQAAPAAMPSPAAPNVGVPMPSPSVGPTTPQAGGMLPPQHTRQQFEERLSQAESQDDWRVGEKMLAGIAPANNYERTRLKEARMLLATRGRPEPATEVRLQQQAIERDPKTGRPTQAALQAREILKNIEAMRTRIARESRTPRDRLSVQKGDDGYFIVDLDAVAAGKSGVTPIPSGSGQLKPPKSAAEKKQEKMEQNLKDMQEGVIPDKPGQKLTDENVANVFLTRAGGDPAKARQLAKEKGWTF